MDECLNEVMSLIDEISNDEIVPKNVKKSMQELIIVLNSSDELAVRCDKAIQLISITDETNIDMFTKSRLWSLLSNLESAMNQ